MRELLQRLKCFLGMHNWSDAKEYDEYFDMVKQKVIRVACTHCVSCGVDGIERMN